jgi:hypothetical protein
MRTALSIAVGMALALVAPAALAQDTTPTQPPPTSGGTGTAGGGVDASAGVAPPKVTTKTVTTTEPAGGGAKEEDTTPDHEKFAGHFAVGYLGLTNIPLGGGGSAVGVTQGTLPAPVIGMRYWLNKQIGIDAGLGFALASSSSEVERNNTTTTVDGPAPFGLAVHGGVPLALAAGKHYTFELIPEANVAFARQADKSNQPNNPPPDLVHTGFRLDVGARVGAEIHFGFIGVPELALQASVGLFFVRQVWKNSQDGINNAPPQSSSIGVTGLGTTVQSDPWAMFTNNIAALYYF